MIIDSHVYCFEPADSPAGYASGGEHLKWVQASQAYHHQPAFRIRDRAPGPSDILDPDGRSDIANLPDLNFRINHARGRVVWEWQGEEYTKHFYPAQPAQLRVHRHEQAYKEKDIEQGEAA